MGWEVERCAVEVKEERPWPFRSVYRWSVMQTVSLNSVGRSSLLASSKEERMEKM